MLNQNTIQAILGITEKVYLKPEEMADKMNITFFPFDKTQVSPEVLYFRQKLEDTFNELHVNIVPYGESLTVIPLHKVFRNILKILVANCMYGVRSLLKLSKKGHYFNMTAISFLFKRIKVKKGISIVVTGEQLLENLPMQYIYSFKDNSIVSILDFPKNISETSSFHEHFDTALNLFVEHMTNIVIGVNKEKWLLYNFNASHPIFPLNTNFKENVLHALVPKIVAPIRPYKLSEFIISKNHFDITDDKHRHQVKDLVDGALLFSQTNLYPDGKKIDSLPFRNDFYRWIGKLHLDNRNGMSYGFLAVQLPGGISELIKKDEFESQINHKIDSEEFLFVGNELYIQIILKNEKYWMKVPEVWVLSQKSGSDKTHVNPQRDLIKLGLSNGKMIIETQYGAVIDNDYKTSFDTQVILAHAVGNAIIASILAHNNQSGDFVRQYTTKGISISHWHGYIHPQHVPAGWYVHGVANPHVACSSPQSALFALGGKLNSFIDVMGNGSEYHGDIHIEPHHGTNICYTSVKDLANYLLQDKNASMLGNTYYYLYNDSVC
ncbi:MAG: hypothetical protein QG589_69 [Patescibacteria group bacterium]|nr:hypothetical protein [Patescibacteria group bacterium]